MRSDATCSKEELKGVWAPAVDEIEARQVDRSCLTSPHLVDAFLVWPFQAQEDTVASQEVDLHSQNDNASISLSRTLHHSPRYI